MLCWSNFRQWNRSGTGPPEPAVAREGRRRNARRPFLLPADSQAIAPEQSQRCESTAGTSISARPFAFHMQLEERMMMKLKLVGATAILATAAFVTPAMSQEATQEPGMIGFN